MDHDYASGRQKLLGHLAGLLFALLIAGSFSVGHLAAPHFGPAALNAVRFAIAVLILLAINVALFKKLPSWPVDAWRFVIVGALMATYFILMFVALRLSTPVGTGAVFTLIPLMSAGFGWLLLRQTTGVTVITSLLIAAAGAIWVIFRGDVDAILGLKIGAGEAIFFIGCSCHAIVAPLVKKFNRGEPGVYFTLGSVTCTAIWITFFGIPELVTTNWSALPSIVWIAIAYLAIFTTAGTFFLVQFASMRLPSSKVLSYGYLTPAAIIIIEGAIGHGWPSASVLLGASVTAAALLVMALAPDN